MSRRSACVRAFGRSSPVSPPPFSVSSCIGIKSRFSIILRWTILAGGSACATGTLAGSMAANTALPGTNLSELAGHAGVRECLQFFTREKQWINEVHLQACRIAAPTFLEQERAAWFLEQFRGYGCDASIDRAGNVVAALGPPPYVALTAHLDTVLAPRNKEESSVDAEGRFRGPGVSDNGAGLAALLAIARAWKSSGKLPQ